MHTLRRPVGCPDWSELSGLASTAAPARLETCSGRQFCRPCVTSTKVPGPMQRSLRRPLAIVFAVAVAALLLRGGRTERLTFSARETLAAARVQKWYTGNLHTH